MKKKSKPSWYWVFSLIGLVGIAVFIFVAQNAYVKSTETNIHPTTKKTSAPAEAAARPPEEPGQPEPGEPESLPEETGFPPFPWPPPAFSSRYEIPLNELIETSNRDISLGDINMNLRQVLERSGFEDPPTYFGIPNSNFEDDGVEFDGFALVTQLERIQDDGTPTDDRFSIKLEPRQIFSLEDYIKILFTRGDPSYFRLIVFLITDEPFAPSDKSPKWSETELPFGGGFDKLPEEVTLLPFTDGHSISALIYEFKRSENGNATLMEPGNLTAKAHMEKSAILEALAEGDQ